MARWAVENPYLEKFTHLTQAVEVMEGPLGQLAGMFGMGFDTRGATRESRIDLTQKYGFAIPNKAALNFVASWGPIVEMGAGTGYWAHLLRRMRVNVIAYDNFEGHSPNTYGFDQSSLWTPITKGNTARLRDHPDRTLFLCWPDYNSPFAANCLRYYAGDRLIYVGEGSGGCTGNARFHRLLEEEWDERKRIVIPRWPMIHDRLVAYERKEKHVKRRR